MPELGCSGNAAIAYDFLVRKGLRDFQAAAIVGNLQQESRVDPRAFNPGEDAIGIAQWRFNRREGLLRLAAETGRDAASLEVQLEFLWHELETVSAFGLARIRSARSLEEAVVVFQDRFERCRQDTPELLGCDTSSRIAFARAALLACPAVQLPAAPTPVKRLVTAAIGAVALATAAGYAAVLWIRGR